MVLEEYIKKRNFGKTKEPPGEVRKGEGNIYVIQEHHATHLHWDLRLEMDGVLKSWAVPKEPPAKPGIKRLAVETEDHPMDYAKFEGAIPTGQYGAGIVKIWDSGTYEPQSMEPDKLVFKLNGKRLKGVYCLIRFKSTGPKNWLFFRNE